MLFVSARIKDRNKVVKTISEKQIKQNSRKEAIMMKEDKVMLNDEEMDNVSGGKTTLTCEIKYNETKKAHYVRVHKVTQEGSFSTDGFSSFIADSIFSIGLDKIQEFFKRYPDAEIVGKDGKPFSIPKGLV